MAPGNLQGITLAPQPAYVLTSLADVLDYRPSFSVVALHAPVGPDRRRRTSAGLCDLAARQLLGARAGAAVPRRRRGRCSTPRTFEEAKQIDPSLDIVRWRSLPKAAEAIREVQSWRQRVVWEVNPELAFTPDERRRRSALRPPHHARPAGAAELARGQAAGHRAGPAASGPKGVREGKLLDALADLWTARRIMARAITRLADPPAWDDDGVRMDIVC